MASPAALNPLQVYLDTSVMIDLCFNSEPRYGEAQRLLEIFERHISPAMQIQVFVSSWARMEAHSRIYEKLLEKKQGITKAAEYRTAKRIKEAGKPPRDCFPPYQSWLREATGRIDKTLEELRRRSQFRLRSPDVAVWALAVDIAEQAAIYPLDSIHVATAVYWGCSLFIATDRDLLDKIALHDSFIQRLFRASLFLPGSPDFEAVSLGHLRRRRPAKTYGDALGWLANHGY